MKYKERGLLSSKTTTIKSRDESKTVTAKDASDSKGVKFTIGSTGYIVDGLDILQSPHPGESAYTWVVGAETGYVIGETLLFAGIYLGIPYRFTLIGSGVLGGTAGNVMQDKLEQAFHEWHGENEQKKSDISK